MISATASPLAVSISSTSTALSSSSPTEIEDTTSEIIVLNKDTTDKQAHAISSKQNSDNKKKTPTPSRTNHRNQYLSIWEKHPAAQYKTITYDNFGLKNERFLSWLFYQNNSMRCRLCENYNKTVNTNGKVFYLLFFFVDTRIEWN